MLPDMSYISKEEVSVTDTDVLRMPMVKISLLVTHTRPESRDVMTC